VYSGGVRPGLATVRPMATVAWLDRLGPERGSIDSEASVLSARSHRSVASFASTGSVLSAASAWSIGSVGSALSIGSVGSFLSIGSVGSVLSIGSVGSACSIGTVGGAGTTRSAEAGPTAPVVRLAGLLAWSALAAAALAPVRRG